SACPVTPRTIGVNAAGKEVARATAKEVARKGAIAKIGQELVISGPMLWSIENPYLYKATSQVEYTGKVADRYETVFGIRHFVFDKDKGFILNGNLVKIRGVCDHYDLG